ncbi:HPr family phosphocarrier protein [Salmonella enterica]|uniref:HPr family phosphocarrier protein n=1 Tax=Salmonella enterica TaxID=28901 RepID=UPI003D785E96
MYDFRQKSTRYEQHGASCAASSYTCENCQKYQSSLTLVNNDKEIPIKGMMSILGAGVKGNTMIDLICDGQDELAFYG